MSSGGWGGGCTLAVKVLKFECFSIDFPVCWTGVTEGVRTIIYFGYLSPTEAPMKSSSYSALSLFYNSRINNHAHT